jgi:hypothetical protein
MDSFNFSAVTTHRKCAKLFQYVYVDKLKQETPMSGDMQFGQAIHLGIETYLEGDNGIDAFNTFWDIEKNKGNAYGRFDWAALKDQGNRLLDLFNRRHKGRFEVFQMEQRLYGEYGDIKLEGTPDVVGKFDGVESIIDFKTSGYRYHKDKIRVAEQLYLYAYLAQTKLNYPVKQLVYLPLIKGMTPSIQTAQIVKFNQDDCEMVLDDLRFECKELLAKQANKVFTRNRGSCIVGDNVCPFFNKCFPKGEKDE